jgi:ABC-2 type transport system permease protein
MTLLKQEWKMNIKSLLIWTLCVGLCCSGCILLFDSVAESMEEMAKSFSEMGSFSAAFGMDKVSVATLPGFYATEISIIFLLGGAMFAAMTGAVLLSKEEEGHTMEFLHTMPVSRTYIYLWKYVALLLLIIVFNAVCIGLDVIGFVTIGEEIAMAEYVEYHILALVMQIEIGSICYLISSVCKRKQIGLALGIAVLFYLMDIMCNIVPDLEFLRFFTPFYYANAAQIYSGGDSRIGLMFLGLAVTIVAVFAGGMVYKKRDMAA